MRFTTLDSWRGICAITVALFHFPLEGALQSAPIIRNGWLFVDFFFVLSGFVLATVYEGRIANIPDTIEFVIRRFGRLWPLHVVMLGAFIAVAIFQQDFSGERHSIDAIFTNIALIHGLGMHSDITWNGPSWSISIEFALYVIFAFILLSFRNKNYYLAPIILGFSTLMYIGHGRIDYTYDFGIFRGLFGFFTGCLISRIKPRKFGTALEFIAVAFVIAFVSSGKFQIVAPIIFGTAIYVFSRSDGIISNALNIRPLVAVGKWSYSIYMVHAAVIAAMVMLKIDKYPFSPIVFIAITIALSSVTYRVIEGPGQRAFALLAKSARLRASNAPT